MDGIGRSKGRPVLSLALSNAITVRSSSTLATCGLVGGLAHVHYLHSTTGKGGEGGLFNMARLQSNEND